MDESPTRIFFDFETYYSSSFSLKNLSIEAYCRSPLFEVLLGACGAVNDDGVEADIVHGTWSEMSARLKKFMRDYPGAAWVAHNAWFDGYILENHFHLHPKKIYCTAAMANFVGDSWRFGRSLRALSAAYGRRKEDFLVTTLGKRKADLTSEELLGLENYCYKDMELAWDLFYTYEKHFSEEAFDMLDMSIRMYTNPRLVLDRGKLSEYMKECERRQEECREKLQRLFKFESREDFLKALRSPIRFVAMLRALGHEPPMKVSKTRERNIEAALAEASRYWISFQNSPGLLTAADVSRMEKIIKELEAGVKIPALAKSDPEFMELLDSDDEELSLLCRMRADNNSSVAVSRARTLYEIAERSGTLSVPLMAWGAHTGRYTAGLGSSDASDKTNLQNLPKRGGDLRLREAIKAPSGFMMVAGDSSQIEARVGAWMAGQNDLVDLFRRGEDPYVDMASTIYNIPAAEIQRHAKGPEKKPEYFKMREVGKTTILSAQYGIGAAKFSKYLLNAGIALSEDRAEHDRRAKQIVLLYAAKYPAIKAFRGLCESWIRTAAADLASKTYYDDFQIHPCLRVTCRDGYCLFTNGCGMRILYPNLRWKTDRGHMFGGCYVYDIWSYGKPSERKLYGGALFNNLVQGTAFNILWRQGVMINKKYPVVANVHDSWITLVREHEVPEAEKYILDCLKFSFPGTVFETLPLSAEVQTAENYSVA
jgi:DNA polymerase